MNCSSYVVTSVVHFPQNYICNLPPDSTLGDSNSSKKTTKPFVTSRVTGSIDFFEKLGEGVFGTVWKGKIDRARFKSVKRPFQKKANPTVYSEPKLIAVKELKNFSKLKQNFREAIVAKRIKQEGISVIPRLFDVIHVPHKNKFIIEKFCNQGSAYAFFQKRDGNKLARFVKIIEILKAIKSLHDEGYYHRDIHEGNILMHKKRKTKVEKIYITDINHLFWRQDLGKKRTERKLPPLNNLPVYMANSPRKIHKIYLEAQAKNSFKDYNRFVDKNAYAIDAYQTGMMLFRLFSTPADPFESLGDEHGADGFVTTSQWNLVRYMDVCLNDSSKVFDLRGYLTRAHPEIHNDLVDIIVGLMNPQPISMESAIQQLSDFVDHYFPE